MVWFVWFFFTVSYLVKNSQGVLKLSPFVFTELVPFALPATGSNEKNVSWDSRGYNEIYETAFQQWYFYVILAQFRTICATTIMSGGTWLKKFIMYFFNMPYVVCKKVHLKFELKSPLVQGEIKKSTCVEG
jgi:hypothetical protein